MPALPSLTLFQPQLQPLLRRYITTGLSSNSSSNATEALQVVCAFPVSGQYGPGSRVLYYLLVAVCVFARREVWLRKACLAAALLFPAVAALHGIVLASVHLDTAVDMDVFGAFQLCSIGILAAPVTVRLSRTYFNDPGRNFIFVWTVLILGGLVSLTVEFFRINTTRCPLFDGTGNPISLRHFNYTNPPTCGLTCSIEEGPFSPIRKGAVNNIYVIPAPTRLTFGTATLLAAGCCIPAILSWVSMWNKILWVNWKRSYFGGGNEEEENQEENVRVEESLTKVNSFVRRLLNVVEVPLFGGAVLGILIMGEWNLFSRQVQWQTEPMSSIGQWAPIVGTVLAIMGSLSLFLTKIEVEDEKQERAGSADQGSPPMDQYNRSRSPASARSVPTPPVVDLRRARTYADGEGRISHDKNHLTSPLHRAATTEDKGNRRRVAKVLIAIGDRLGTASANQFDDSEFKHGKALDFPEIPGEEQRNKDLTQIRDRYNHSREAEGAVTPGRQRSTSRAPSFAGSTHSGLGIEGSPISRSASPSPSIRRPRGYTLPHERDSAEIQNATTSSPSGANEKLARRDTLDVPSPIRLTHIRTGSAGSTAPFVARSSEGPSSPAIVVSPDPLEPDADGT